MSDPHPKPPGFVLDRTLTVRPPGPVTCAWCDEIIDATIYILRPHVPFGMHPECAIRSVVGSVGHQMGLCGCHGGDQDDPPRMTRREAAIAAMKLWESRYGAWN